MYVGHLKKVDKKHLRKAAYCILPMSKPMSIISWASLANEVTGRESTLEEPFPGPLCSPSPSPKYFSLTKKKKKTKHPQSKTKTIKILSTHFKQVKFHHRWRIVLHWWCRCISLFFFFYAKEEMRRAEYGFAWPNYLGVWWWFEN